MSIFTRKEQLLQPLHEHEPFRTGVTIDRTLHIDEVVGRTPGAAHD